MNNGKWALFCVCLLISVEGQAAPATAPNVPSKPSSSTVGMFRPQTAGSPVFKPTTVTPVIKPTTVVVVEHPVTTTPVWKPTTPVATFQSPIMPFATNTSAKDAPTTMGGNVLSQPKDFKKEAGEKKGYNLQSNVGGFAQKEIEEIDPNDKNVDALRALSNKNNPLGSIEEMKKQASQLAGDKGLKGLKDRIQNKAAGKKK